jgi:hypothetical protein
MAPPQGRTAVYRFFDKSGRLLYVGITHDTKVRFAAHAKDKTWWPAVSTREIVWCPTRRDAECEEVHAIATENPEHNSSPGILAALPKPVRSFYGWKPSTQSRRLLAALLQAERDVIDARIDLEEDAIRELAKGTMPSTLSRFYPWRSEDLRRLKRQPLSKRRRQSQIDTEMLRLPKQRDKPPAYAQFPAWLMALRPLELLLLAEEVERRLVEANLTWRPGVGVSEPWDTHAFLHATQAVGLVNVRALREELFGDPETVLEQGFMPGLA